MQSALSTFRRMPRTTAISFTMPISPRSASSTASPSSWPATGTSRAFPRFASRTPSERTLNGGHGRRPGPKMAFCETAPVP